MAYWLITWEFVDNEEEIAAILNYRLSAEMVKRFVELLYVNKQFTLSERLEYAKNRKNNTYLAEFERIKGVQWQGRINCGHNPWLCARLVDNLHIEIDNEGNEILRWDERPVPESVM
jgi:hypothetical protein